MAPSSSAATLPTQRLPLPPTVQRDRVLWIYAIPIAGIHLLGLCALIPWFFSWSALIVAMVSVPLYGLGITLCYHRLLAHRSFKCPKWLERCFVGFALCSMEDTPAKWVATHRLHHIYSDEPADPHSPLVGLFWGHLGWLLLYNSGTRSISAFQRYARDILEDPFYLRLEKGYIGVWIYAAHALAYYLIGLGVGYWYGGTLLSGVQFGLSLLVWGVFIRTILVWHITWSVNSLTHIFGYQNYKTNENSRNNWLVAILALGEGWHNNHHHDPAGCTVRHRWWEIDITYGVVLALWSLGLAWDIIPPRHVRQSTRGEPSVDSGAGREPSELAAAEAPQIALAGARAKSE